MGVELARNAVFRAGRRRWLRAWAWLWLPWAALGFSARGPAAAQTPPALAEVEELLARGRILRARDRLLEWWETERPGASREDLQRGIWLRGQMTVDPSMAEADFRRLVLEFPGGPFSDDALLRLGQLAELRGDVDEARRSWGTLIRDYPASPLRVDAAAWLARLGDNSGSRRPPDARGRSVPDPGNTESVETEKRVPPEGFSLQFGAFGDPARARALADRLEEEGLTPRLVRLPGSTLVRVRVGVFERREDAEAAREELARRGYTVVLATGIGRELPWPGGRVGGRRPAPRP